MTSEQIERLRKGLGSTATSTTREDVFRLLDEREALLEAAKEAAEGLFDVIAADDSRLLALLRNAIAKAESP